MTDGGYCCSSTGVQNPTTLASSADNQRAVLTCARRPETGVILSRLQLSLACVHEDPGRVDRLLVHLRRV
jgi:hypothetical protein